MVQLIMCNCACNCFSINETKKPEARQLYLYVWLKHCFGVSTVLVFLCNNVTGCSVSLKVRIDRGSNILVGLHLGLPFPVFVTVGNSAKTSF